MFINHVNYVNENGTVYCCLRNKLVEFNQLQINHFCSGCNMKKGINQESVLCYWQDNRKISDPHIVFDPKVEYLSMQRRKLEVV